MTDPTPADAPDTTPATTTQPGTPSPADVTNEVNRHDDALETREIELFTLTETTEDGQRTLEINRPTTYFEVADAAEVTISAFELANRNGVHNSVYDIPAGATIIIPAPQLPIPADPPAVGLEEATAQALKTQEVTQSVIAGAIDAQAGIDPASDASTAGAAPLVIDGGTPPSTATADAPIPVEVPVEVPAAGDTAPSPAAPDAITTPDHPSVAKVEPSPIEAQVTDAPAGDPLSFLANLPTPTGAPVPSAGPEETSGDSV